jgi:hypothetical protein
MIIQIAQNIRQNTKLIIKNNQSNQSEININKKQVDSLKEKLNMKMSALNAIKTNGHQQDDSKVYKLILKKRTNFLLLINFTEKRVEILDNDIRKLKHDISIYETHLQKTEIWIDNLGKWTTKVRYTND